MPGFLFKHTIIFSGADKGWTESLYFEQQTNDLQAAMNFVSDVKNKRRLLLGKQFSMKGERVALVRTDTGAKVTRQALPNRFFLAGNQQQDGEDTSTSLLVKWVNSVGSRNKVMFMGGPFAAIFPFPDALDRNAGNFTTHFNAWAGLMRALGMGWMHRVRTQTGIILNHVSDPLTGITTYTLEAPGIVWGAGAPPTPVSVEFPSGRSALDGMQIVVPVDATHATTAKPRPSSAFKVRGQMKTFDLEFVNIGTLNGQGNPGTITADAPVGRKRGRPLLVSRGRRPVQVRF